MACGKRAADTQTENQKKDTSDSENRLYDSWNLSFGDVSAVYEILHSNLLLLGITVGLDYRRLGKLEDVSEWKGNL